MAVASEQQIESELCKEEPKVDEMQIEKGPRDRTSNEGSRFVRISYVERFRKLQVPIMKEAWPMVGSALKENGILGCLNRKKCYFKIKTSRRYTKDPDMIERAREFIQLLCKTNVPPSTCVQILNGDLHHEYIKTCFQEDGLCTIHGISKEQFRKQLKSLMKHSEELERLLGCKIYVNGNSATPVSASLWSVKTAKRAVERSFVENVDAADLVKRFALERKLESLRI